MFMLPWVLVPDMCILPYMASTRLLQSRSGGFSLFAKSYLLLLPFYHVIESLGEDILIRFTTDLWGLPNLAGDRERAISRW